MASETAAVLEGQGDLFQRPPRGPVHAISGFAKAKPLGSLCAVILLAVALTALFAPKIVPFRPDVNHSTAGLLSPNHTYIFGTDQFGRDVFSRVVYGARVSLEVGILSTIVALLVGTAIGVTGAYFHGWWDYLTSRVVDLVQALPGLVLLLTLLAAFGRSITSISLVLGLTTGMVGSRVIRGAALTISAQPYVEVARSIGCRPWRILGRYIAVNVMPLVIVLATVNVGTAIVAEASLSFLGFGVPPPNPSWGGMLSKEGRQYMIRAPWLFISPTVALAIVVFSVNMFGDALRDRLDPRLRGG